MKPLTAPGKLQDSSTNIDRPDLHTEKLSIFQQNNPWYSSNWFSHDLHSFIDQMQCRHDTLVIQREPASEG